MNLESVKAALKGNNIRRAYIINWLIEQVEQAQDMERNYTHQLGEMARLCNVVAGCVLAHKNEWQVEEFVASAATEIMEYVDAVRPGKDEPETKWGVHIIGPDDIYSCRGEFDALRRANQHNIFFAQLMADDPSPNDPYCVAVAEQI